MDDSFEIMKMQQPVSKQSQVQFLESNRNLQSPHFQKSNKNSPQKNPHASQQHLVGPHFTNVINLFMEQTYGNQSRSFIDTQNHNLPFEKSFQVITPQQLLQYFQKEHKSQCPTDILDFQVLKKSPKLLLKKYKHSVYFGEVINNKRHGKGVMLYDNGRIYEGFWQNQHKFGKGYQKFSNGSFYEGQYINGKPQGAGKFIWPNGEFYEGEWQNGMKHGSGMWKGAKGDSYVGEWKFGKADGYGVHHWINGDRYQGDFQQCVKHGEGIQKFANGDIYKGKYSFGKPSGYGQYYWNNGSYYKGYFLEGSRHGHGIWKKSQGISDKFQGQYYNDKKQGYGIFTWQAGNVYKGNYQHDCRNGYGEMYWTDGSYYKGFWKDGVQHGEGEIFTIKEGLKKGIFEQNIMIFIQQIKRVQQESHQNNKAHKLIHQHTVLQQQDEPKGIKSFSGKFSNKESIKIRQSRPQSRYRQQKKINHNLRKTGINFRTIQPLQSKHSHQITTQDQTSNDLLMRKTVDINNQNTTISNFYKNEKKWRNRRKKILSLKQASELVLHKTPSKSKERVLHSAMFMHKLHSKFTSYSANKTLRQQKATFDKDDQKSSKKEKIMNEIKIFTKGRIYSLKS